MYNLYVNYTIATVSLATKEAIEMFTDQNSSQVA